jgi:hypothetical protein
MSTFFFGKKYTKPSVGSVAGEELMLAQPQSIMALVRMHVQVSVQRRMFAPWPD